MRINAVGEIYFPKLVGPDGGIVVFGPLGNMEKLSYSGIQHQVLTGNGSWSSIQTITGWSVNNGSMMSESQYNVGIGTNYAPTEKLEVNGNFRASGCVYTQCVSAAGLGTFQSLNVTNGTSLLGGLTVDQLTINGRQVTPTLWQDDGTNEYLLDGNVGIRTSTPIDPLTVIGQGRFYNTLSTGFLTIGHNGADAYLLNNSGVGKLLINYNTGSEVQIGTGSSPSDLIVGRDLKVGANLFIDGADFKLGLNDGRSKGSLTEQRAIVHDNNDILTINYGGDFEGGVNINGVTKKMEMLG
jgi:hypothetical protein